MTLSKSVMPSKHLLFRLAVSTLPTSEIGSGLLRAPDAGMERGQRSTENMKGRIDRGMPLNLNDQLNAISQGLIPTPQASDPTSGSVIGANDTFRTTTGLPRKITQNGTDGNVGLGRLVQMIPTPAARNWKGAGTRNENTVPNVIEGRERIGTKTGLKLQPGFVEWMMGYPEDWSSLTDMRTAKQMLEG